MKVRRLMCEKTTPCMNICIYRDRVSWTTATAGTGQQHCYGHCLGVSVSHCTPLPPSNPAQPQPDISLTPISYVISTLIPFHCNQIFHSCYNNQSFIPAKLYNNCGLSTEHVFTGRFGRTLYEMCVLCMVR